MELATDPAMIYYLDNQMSHKDAVNENWGRELLELFSLGVGMDGHANYSEDDVKECARAFTGWTGIGGCWTMNRHRSTARPLSQGQLKLTVRAIPA